MDKKIMKFDNTGIEEYNVHFINFIKRHISINDIDIDKIVESNKQKIRKI